MHSVCVSACGVLHTDDCAVCSGPWRGLSHLSVDTAVRQSWVGERHRGVPPEHGKPVHLCQHSIPLHIQHWVIDLGRYTHRGRYM